MKPYIFILLLLLCLTGCGGGETAAESSSAPAAETSSLSEGSAGSAGEESSPEPELLEAEYISWPGFLDKTVTEDDHTLTLANDGENGVSLSFLITEEDGTILYESEAVAPGEADLWDIYEAYTAGTHTVIITTIAEPGNQLEQQISLTLPEEEE